MTRALVIIWEADHDIPQGLTPHTHTHTHHFKCAPPLTLLHMHSPCCRSGWAPTRSRAGCRSCCSPGPGPFERRACTPDRPASLRSWGTALRCTASSCLQTAVARGGEGLWEMPGGAPRGLGLGGLPAEDSCTLPAWFKVSWTGAAWPRCCSCKVGLFWTIPQLNVHWTHHVSGRPGVCLDFMLRFADTVADTYLL